MAAHEGSCCQSSWFSWVIITRNGCHRVFLSTWEGVRQSISDVRLQSTVSVNIPKNASLDRPRGGSNILVSIIITHTIHHCLLFACIDQVSFSLKGSYNENLNFTFVQCVYYTKRDISDNVRLLVRFSDNPSSDKYKYSITISYSWATGILSI